MKKPLTEKAGNLAQLALKTKTIILRSTFYCIGKVYTEAVGREINWAQGRLSIEEDARDRDHELCRCEHCGCMYYKR